MMIERRKKQPPEGSSFIDDFIDWMGTEEAETSNEVLDLVWTILEKVDVDAKGRKLVWEDGQRHRLPSPSIVFMQTIPACSAS